MKIIDRYLFREFITPFLYCTLAFFILYLVADLFEHMDEFLASQIPLRQLMLYYFYTLPTILIRTTPFSMVLASTYELGRFAKHLEVVGMQSCAIPLKRIALPLFEVGVILSAFYFLTAEFVLPTTSLRSTLISQTYLDTDEGTKKIYQDIAYSSILKNFVVYIRELDLKHHQAQEIQVHQMGPQGSLECVTRAKTGVWLDGAWWLFDGTISRFDPEGNPMEDIVNFKKMKGVLQLSPKNLIREENASEHLNYKEMKESLKYKFGRDIPQGHLVKLFSKLSAPWAYLILMLVIVPLGLKIPRGGGFMVLGKVIVITLSYFCLEFFFQALGKQGHFHPITACSLPIIIYGSFGALSCWRLK